MKFTCGEYTKEHFRFECACGAVVSEYSCDRPDKTVGIEARACLKCRHKRGRLKGKGSADCKETKTK